MTPRTITLLLTAFAALAVHARAQPVSEAERAYGAALARTLESTHGSEVLRYSPRPDITGVRVALGPLRVERVTFATAEKAQKHVRHVLDAELSVPLVGELRGKQVVFVRGERVRDAAFARRALTAAWEGTPAAASDATFANIGKGELALTTRLPSGPVRAGVDEALAKARQHPGQPGFTLRPDGAHVVLSSGFRADMRSDAAGASLFAAYSAEREAAMKQYLGALGGHPAPVTAGLPGATRRATEGAAGVLGGLFPGN